VFTVLATHKKMTMVSKGGNSTAKPLRTARRKGSRAPRFFSFFFEVASMIDHCPDQEQTDKRK